MSDPEPKFQATAEWASIIIRIIVYYPVLIQFTIPVPVLDPPPLTASPNPVSVRVSVRARSPNSLAT